MLSPETRDAFRRGGHLIRPIPNGIEVYTTSGGDPTAEVATKDDPGRILLCIDAPGSDYLLFSDACLSRQDTVAYCSPESGAGALDEQGRIRLHPGPQLAETDLVPRHLPPVAALLTGWPPGMRPALIVDLPMPGGYPAADGGSAARRYLVSVAASSTYWTYYLLGTWVDRRLGIVDLDHAIDFELLGPVALSRDLRAQGLRSTTPIPFRQRSTCRFQLREFGTARERVLIKRLPVARPRSGDRQAIAGTMAAISEIFING